MAGSGGAAARSKSEQAIGDGLVELRRMAGPVDAGAHAIFLHGLRGSIERTWAQTTSEELWPAWFSNDVPNLAVWAVGYAAPASRWGGQESMPLPDTASAILQKITYEPELRSGNIALVGYSLGGVIAKALLRKAPPVAIRARQRKRPLADAGTRS